jgi:WD40 repeat protein
LTLDTPLGLIQLLDNEAWLTRRERLIQRGGPPDPSARSSEFPSGPLHEKANSIVDPGAGRQPLVEVDRFLDDARAVAEFAAFSPDGRRVLACSADETIRLWDGESGRLIRRVERHGGHLLSVAFSPEGRRALSGGQDRVVRLWDLDSGALVRELKGHTEWVFTGPPGLFHQWRTGSLE